MKDKAVKSKIGALKFSLISPDKLKKLSVAKIVTPELYDIDGFPVDGGLMDLRMGVIDPGLRCRTDGAVIKECPGYPGRIDMARPVIHLKYITLVETGLRCFCHECGKLLLADKDLEKYPNKSKRAKRAKDGKKCPHCGAEHPKVKIDKPTSFYMGRTRIFPTEIREIVSKISDDELRKIGINPETSRPEWAVLTSLLVPAVTVRPSIILESGERSEDDLTHKLSDIIRANQRLWENLNAGAPEVIIEDLWDLLQYHVTTFFDNAVARVPPARHRSGQPLKTITERIKGKEGRIRKNLAGKRVNFSARSVISPDPSLEINEVGVPFEIAKTVTVAETVTDMNIDKLKVLVERGADYPGANYVIRPDGKRKKITGELKEEIINELSSGYKVERHLQNGDIVLFNRHPSLHRASLMAHFVKVLPWRTLRLHPAACAPYNADFDGDEMNIHSPQTEEARAEAKMLLDVKNNLISPKNNTNLLGNIKDGNTGCYLVGLSDFTSEEANQLLYKIGIDKFFTKKTVSGNELFSAILPNVDFENDSIKIKGGKIIEGRINKTTFGKEDGELLKEIDRVHGREAAVQTLKKAFDLGVSYMTNRGITVSVEDLDLDQKVIDSSNDVIAKAERNFEELIASYEDGSLELIPGKSAEDSREIKILQALNNIRTKVGQLVKKNFPDQNPVNHMMSSGGGGNALNISQMAATVGQQAFEGGRISFGFKNRTLSFFAKNDLSPRARGFIYSPFIRGLRADELFFQAITGRDGLMDTALRTPKSGYLYRRLANALQDIRVEYDGSVRDSNNNIIQTLYGEDGKEVSELHNDKNVCPGECVGLLAAQSFGESSTQMVLNVFHHAGVAEMQVTTGLPRLIEIFDARKKPSSPKMEIFLKKEFNDEKTAKVLAERLKEVKLKEIASEINLNFGDKTVEIKVSSEGLRRAHVTLKTVVDRLQKIGFSVTESSNAIVLEASDKDYKEIYKLKEKLKETIISGVKNVEQVLLVKQEGDFMIMTLGSNLTDVLEFKEVDPDRLISNDLHEVAKVFGVECARSLIIQEVAEVLDSQGLDIDNRHFKLVADAMTNTGVVKGITRMGIIAQKSSILARATFETPVRQFVNASVKGSKDELTSVIENIILNQPVPVGTGLPGLLVKIIGPLIKKESEKKLADSKTVEKTNK